MERDLSPDQARELLGAFALGAVGPDEAEAVEELVLDDHDARAELHALQLGASWLSATELTPEPRVWERIAAEIDAEVSTLVRFRPRRALTARVLAYAAAVVVLVVVGAGVILLAAGGSDDRSRVEIAAAEAARDPSSQPVRLAGAHGQVTTVLTPDGRGYVLDSDMRRLTDDETYQLWAITPSGDVSAGVLGRSPGVQVFRIPAGTSSLAVTAEPKGGSTSPTSPILARAVVTS